MSRTWLAVLSLCGVALSLSNIRVKDGNLHLSVDDGKTVMFHSGSESMPIDDLQTIADSDNNLANLQNQIESEMESLHMQVQKNLTDLKSDFIDALDDERDATDDSIEDVLNMLKGVNSTVNDINSTVDDLIQHRANANFQCMQGWGGRSCDEDATAPVVTKCTNDHGNEVRIFFKTTKPTVLVTGNAIKNFHKPTIMDTGPTKRAGVTVELIAKIESGDVSVGKWTQAKNSDGEYDMLFDWSTGAPTFKNVVAPKGITIFQYVISDPADNVATCDLEVQVGEQDECADNTHNCDENALCTNLQYTNQSAKANGTFHCTCNQYYTGDGFECKEIPCLTSTLCKGNKIKKSGFYRVCSGGEVYCDMEVDGGGWTLVANINPTDGNSVGYNNQAFWSGSGEYGTSSKALTNDYKSPFAQSLKGKELLTTSNDYMENGGKTLGWRKWSFTNTWDSMFVSYIIGVHGRDYCQTGSQTGRSIGSASGWDEIIRQGNCLYTDVNPSGSGWRDLIRLTTIPYNYQDNKMAGFASCIDCGYPWQGSAHQNMGIDRAACNTGSCHYNQISRLTDAQGRSGREDCRGNYCGGTYRRGWTKGWTSRFFIR